MNVITDILHGDTSSANIMAHRSRICGLVDIATIGGAVTDFAVQGFSCALQVCPLRSAPLSRRFFPRKLQGRCGRLAVTRRFLCLARTLVSTHVRNARPGSLIRTDLAQSLLNHATVQKARHVLSPTAFADVLPPLPGDDSLPAWHLWASQCHVRLNSTRVAFNAVHRQHASASDVRRRRALNKLLYTRPKLAHRHIFSPDDDPLVLAGISALRDPSAADPFAPIVGQPLLDYVGDSKSASWDAPPITPDTSGPYPFDPSVAGVTDPFTLRTLAHGSIPPPPMLTTVLDPAYFAFVCSSLTNGKAPGPDRVPNEILKLMPPSFMQLVHKVFILFWLCGKTPDAWKVSYTKLLHKRGDHMLLSNFRPLGLNNCLYKLWTRFLTNALSDFADHYNILSMCQEGFRKQCNTTRQLQRMVLAVEDAFHFKQDLFVMYIDFTNAFNTVDHAKLRQIMLDLGFPSDVVSIIADLYVNATTVIHVGNFGSTRPIRIRRGTIQGDILSPFLFLIFLEPLLRWLKVGSRGYPFQVLSGHDRQRTVLASPAYADDLALPTCSLGNLRVQFDKVTLYCKWGNLLVNASKCAVSAILHHSHPLHPCHAAHITAALKDQFAINGSVIPHLPPHKPYPYLGCEFTLTLDWKSHFLKIMQCMNDKAKHLLASGISPLNSLLTIKRCLKPILTYSFGICPFSTADLTRLDVLLVRLTKMCMDLPTAFPNRAVLAPLSLDGVGLSSLFLDYYQANVKYLIRALNDTHDLGIIIRASLLDTIRRCGNLPLTSGRTLLSKHCMCMRQLSLLQDSSLRIRLHGAIQDLVGNDMWSKLKRVDSTTCLPTSLLYPLWDLGIFDFAQLLDSTSPRRVCVMPSDAFRAMHAPRAQHEHMLALNRLTLVLHGCLIPVAMSHLSHLPLSAELRKVSAAMDFIDLPLVRTPSTLPPVTSDRQRDARTRVEARLSRDHILPKNRPRPHAVEATTLPGYRDPFAPIIAPHLGSQPPPDPLLLSILEQQGVWGCPQAASTLAATQQLVASHVSIVVPPVNPDLDICPGRGFRLQLGLPGSPSPLSDATAFVYRPSGTLLGHFPAHVAHLLASAYHHATPPSGSPPLSNELSHGAFLPDVAALCARYPAQAFVDRRALPSPLLLAVIRGCSVACDRLSSPFEITADLPCYCSTDPADALFGALADPFSMSWAGCSSLVRPTLINEDMLRAVRWAISSSLDLSRPTLAVFFLPKWPSSAYRSLLSHQHVHSLADLPKGSACLYSP